MNDETKPTAGQQTAEPEQDLVTRTRHGTEIQGSAWQIAELFAIERERIASQDRKTAVIEQAIAANDRADKRQYEYEVEKLHLDDEDRARRLKSGMAILWVLLLAALGCIGILFWMILAGEEVQQENANDLLDTLFTGVGGFGIGWLLLYAFRRLLAR